MSSYCISSWTSVYFDQISITQILANMKIVCINSLRKMSITISLTKTLCIGCTMRKLNIFVIVSIFIIDSLCPSVCLSAVYWLYFEWHVSYVFFNVWLVYVYAYLTILFHWHPVSISLSISRVLVVFWGNCQLANTWPNLKPDPRTSTQTTKRERQDRTSKKTRSLY